MKFLIILFLVSSCGCFNPLDGKASLSCKRGKMAKKYCKHFGGVKNYNYAYFICNNGLKISRDQVSEYWNE